MALALGWQLRLLFYRLVLLVFEWYVSQRRSFRHFIWFLFLLLVVIQWTGLPANPGNFVLLMPGLIFIMQVITERWKNKGELIIYIVTLSLYIILWVVYFSLRKTAPEYSEPVSFYFIFPFVELLLLYWAKWWINKNPAI